VIVCVPCLGCLQPVDDLDGWTDARWSGDFTRGRRLVRLSAIGRASQLAPVNPMGAAARGPRVKSSRPRDLPAVQAAPVEIFAPANRRLWPAGAGAAAGVTTWPPSRRRERPLGAALNPYRKFSQGGDVTFGCPLALWRRPLAPDRALCNPCDPRCRDPSWSTLISGGSDPAANVPPVRFPQFLEGRQQRCT
jgi:hypothetical protein